MISTVLMPAYSRMRDFIRDEYLPKTRETVGLNALPDGAAWYAYNVKSRTTTDLSPQVIHQIGLDEVARIQGEMRKVIKQLKFKGDLQAFFKFLDRRLDAANAKAMETSTSLTSTIIQIRN